MASLNKDDIFEEDTSGEESLRTPHCDRSKSVPGSSSRVPDKTPGKKGPGTNKKAVSCPTTRSERTHTADTPNRLRSDVTANLDGGGENGSGAESDEHNPAPTLPQQPDVSTALKEITSLLNTVVKRIDRVENELTK